MANLQPKDVNSTGSKLNPPIFKTFIPKGSVAPSSTTANTDAPKLFFDFVKTDTSTPTPGNAFNSNPIRSLDFIQGKILGNMG